MEDAEIVQLYWDRNELAIPATAEKYGKYCRAIAGNILGSREDAEECVNDTYLWAWNSIPPSRPGLLSAYLGKITRNLALNRFRYYTAEKRGGGEVPLVLAEIAELVSDTDGVEQEMDRRALAEAVGGPRFVELVRCETHTCYMGDHEHLHDWGYGCGRCPACELRRRGWECWRAEDGKD